jgi:hypothetical protein
MTSLRLMFKSSLLQVGAMVCGAGLLPLSMAQPAMAQPAAYPLTIRASFMQGCLADEAKPNQPVSEGQLKFCLCMMDLVQSKYSYEQFLKLSEAYDKKQPQAKDELEKFFKDNMTTCL